MFKQAADLFKFEMGSIDNIQSLLVNVLDFDDSYDLTGVHPRDRKNVSMHIAFIFESGQPENLNIQNKFPKTIEFIKTISGLEAATCIAIGPKSIMPLHLDDMSRPSYDLNDWYAVLIGIDVPSSDPKSIGLEIDGGIYTHSYGTAIVFDTQVPHSAWNNTDKWWVCLRFRIKKESFKNENIIK